MSRETVRVLDLETREITEIPVTELTAGMVQIRMNGIEGVVWVEGAKLNVTHTCRHGVFTGERRRQVEFIERSLREVYPLSYAEWEEGFRSDALVDSEIAQWVHLCRCYNDHLAWHRPDAEGRREAFRVLTACILGTRASALQLVQGGVKDRARAEELVREFFDPIEKEG